MAELRITVNKSPDTPSLPTLRPGSFVRRKIDIAVQLAAQTGTNQPAQFAGSGSSTITLSGSRVSAQIQNSGAPVNQRATIRVWGMAPSLMYQLSTLGLVFNLVPRNKLTVSAGDDINGMSTVFSGTIQYAYGDYQSQPDVPFVFECLFGVDDATAPVPVSSFQGTTDIADIMAGFARQMGLGFQNNGVSVKEQADQAADEAHIKWAVVNGNVMSIFPVGGNRNTPNVPVISPGTGMIAYPSFTQQGIIVRTLFNPQIAFGGLVRVDSSVLSGIAAAQPALGAQTFPTMWAVNKLDLNLDSLVPKGQWMSTVYAYNPGYSRSLIAPGL
jgi:hypothetical protein